MLFGVTLNHITIARSLLHIDVSPARWSHHRIQDMGLVQRDRLDMGLEWMRDIHLILKKDCSMLAQHESRCSDTGNRFLMEEDVEQGDFYSRSA